MRCITPQTTSRSALMASAAGRPGVRDRFERDITMMTKPARPMPWRAPSSLPLGSVLRSRGPSLTSEEAVHRAWESELLIVAVKPGNAGGAKGQRRSTASQRNMAQTQSWSRP